MKLDRKQDLDVSYQVCVFRADQKTKMWQQMWHIVLRCTICGPLGLLLFTHEHNEIKSPTKIYDFTVWCHYQIAIKCVIVTSHNQVEWHQKGYTESHMSWIWQKVNCHFDQDYVHVHRICIMLKGHRHDWWSLFTISFYPKFHTSAEWSHL